MYNLPELIVVGIVALLVGTGIGVFVTKMFAPDNRKRQELEKQLHTANASLKNYQQEVSEHYVKTAKLVEDLTDSYRNVHNHLAEGAATLLTTRGAAPLMKTIPSREQIEAISELPGKDKVLPPLDYAPKQSPGEKGMLDESFGLDSETEQAKGSPKDPMQEFYSAKSDTKQADKTS